MLATTSTPLRHALLSAHAPLHTAESRYAIYFVPDESSAWCRFGASWLGRDAATNKPVARSDNANTAAFEDGYVERITRGPRRYGLHATLKAPMQLACNYAPNDVYLQTSRLAATQAPIMLTPLQLSVIDGFVALTLAHDPSRNAAVEMLAGHCVATCDNLRARPNAAEIARRQASGLTPRQTTLLLQWGYPHVFEEFRFHITLTGKLSLPEQARVLDALTPMVHALNQEPLVLNGLAVCVQPRHNAPFLLVRRYGFDGSTRCYHHDNV